MPSATTLQFKLAYVRITSPRYTSTAAAAASRKVSHPSPPISRGQSCFFALSNHKLDAPAGESLLSSWHGNLHRARVLACQNSCAAGSALETKVPSTWTQTQHRLVSMSDGRRHRNEQAVEAFAVRLVRALWGLVEKHNECSGACVSNEESNPNK
jgi:hypothetical protein